MKKRSSVIFLSALTLVILFLTSHTGAEEPWTNGLAATYVIGQPDFSSKASGTDDTSFWSPRDVAVDSVHLKLYVADSQNNRVLRFSLPVTGNQPTAELVFGQADMISNADATSRSGLDTPTGVDVDKSGRLWVADQLNNRVVWFDSAYAFAVNGPDADGVLGQPDFVSSSEAFSQSGMNKPTDIAAGEDDYIFVADSENHRVLRFSDAASKAPGANADGVLGQSSFTVNLAATTQSRMNTPQGVALFDSTLYVAELENDRVLRFDNAAIRPNGAYADGVLGQYDFESINYADIISQSRMEAPARIATGPSGSLYVSDAKSANRVLVFSDAHGKNNGAGADSVIGQENFVSFGPGATTQTSFNLDPKGAGMAVDPTTRILAVADDNNNRVMIFQYWQVYLPLIAR